MIRLSSFFTTLPAADAFDSEKVCDLGHAVYAQQSRYYYLWSTNFQFSRNDVQIRIRVELLKTDSFQTHALLDYIARAVRQAAQPELLLSEYELLTNALNM